MGGAPDTPEPSRPLRWRQRPHGERIGWARPATAPSRALHQPLRRERDRPAKRSLHDHRAVSARRSPRGRRAGGSRLLPRTCAGVELLHEPLLDLGDVHGSFGKTEDALAMMFFWMLGVRRRSRPGARTAPCAATCPSRAGVLVEHGPARPWISSAKLGRARPRRGAMELVHRVCADVLALTACERSAGRETHGFDARVRARDAAAHARVLRGRAAVLLALLRERLDLLEAALQARHLGDARALVRERRTP